MSDTAGPAGPARTAARAIAAALLRHALTAAGTYLAHRGWVDQETANSAVGPITEELLGAGVALGSTCWGALRARASHWRWVRAWLAPAEALPPA